MEINEEKILQALQEQVGHIGITMKSGIDFQRLMAVLREVEKQRSAVLTGRKDE